MREEGILSILLVLLMLAAVLALAYVTTRFVGRRYASAGQGGSRLIRVIDRMPISQDKQLLLVRVAGKTMLLGAAAQGISKLCDIDATDLPPVPDDAPGPAFSQIFGSVLRRRPGTPQGGDAPGEKEGQQRDE